MSLENVQRVTNSQRVALGRTSASNNPQQWEHDGREQLIKGAELAAAGRSLGMSEEETLAAVSRQFRRQARADDTVTPTDVLRQMTQAAATTTDYVGTPEIDGVRYEGEDELARAFGESQDDYQNFKADDRGFTTDEETGELRRETMGETRGQYRGQKKDYSYRDGKRVTTYTGEPIYQNQTPVAGKSSVVDALNALKQSAAQQESGIAGRLSALFGGSAVDSETDTAMEALQRHLGSEGKRDARIGRAIVRQDNQNYSPEVREANDYRAQAEADSIARTGFTVNGPGAMGDENIGRIAEIRSLGKIGETAHVVRTANDAIKGQAARRHDGIFLDPVTGDPIAVQGPQLPSVLAGDRTPNNGSSSDQLNAPQTAREWVASNVPDNQDATGKFPQVDITLETTNFANKLRTLDGMGMQGVSSNIRTIDELQRVVDRVVQRSGQQGKQLYRYDPETRRNVPVANPSTPEVMGLMRMSPGDQSRLANALFQIDAAQRSSVNQNPTGTYISRQSVSRPDVIYDAPEPSQFGGGGAQVARVASGTTIRTGETDKGKPVRQTIQSQLAGLSSPDAQRPFIGQVEGEKPRVERYNRTGETEPAKIDAALRVQDEARARRDRKPVDETALKSKQVKAKLVQERENRDAARREERRQVIQQHTPVSMRRFRG